MIRRPPRSPLFPYPPLFRSAAARPPLGLRGVDRHRVFGDLWLLQVRRLLPAQVRRVQDADHAGHQDRKSTRLNSSHSQISYAVFCLKKKKKKMMTVVIFIND